MANPAKYRLSLDEYFAIELSSSHRHEFVDGEVYAMSGASRRHNQVSLNVSARLWAAARGGPCRVYQSDMKYLGDQVVYYPDVMVACGHEPPNEYVEVSPCLVVEVLSPSTRMTDRREKLMVYRGIPGLKAYIVLEQDERKALRYWRHEASGDWLSEVVEGNGLIYLPCPALSLSLDEIYEGVDLPPTEELLRVREQEASIYG